MDIILTDIAISLARAALATFLAKELYSITVPTVTLFSIVLYACLTRDPIRTSLPPWMGIKGIWNVIVGGKKVRQGREIVRLSVFGRDVFWVTEDVFQELLLENGLVQVFHRNGVFMEYGEKERMIVDKVCC